MKYCGNCGSQISDEAVVCVHCGCAVSQSHSNNTNTKKFCNTCGNEVAAGAVVCVKCGCAIIQNPQAGFSTKSELVKQLSEKININGIIWLVIGILQVLIGLFINWVFLVVGALNIVSGVQDMNYSKEIIQNPVGIVDKFKPITGPIIVLVYNLIFGGVIGVVGSIYYFIAIRNFILTNESSFS